MCFLKGPMWMCVTKNLTHHCRPFYNTMFNVSGINYGLLVGLSLSHRFYAFWWICWQYFSVLSILWRNLLTETFLNKVEMRRRFSPQPKVQDRISSDSRRDIEQQQGSKLPIIWEVRKTGRGTRRQIHIGTMVAALAIFCIRLKINFYDSIKQARKPQIYASPKVRLFDLLTTTEIVSDWNFQSCLISIQCQCGKSFTENIILLRICLNLRFPKISFQKFSNLAKLDNNISVFDGYHVVLSFSSASPYQQN